MNVEQKDAYLNKFRTELQSQMIQDLLNKITDNCFKVHFFIF
jgi:hypothetical protein